MTNKSKKDLINEVQELRKRINELEKAEVERKQIEQALRESENKFRNTIQSSPMGMHMYQLEPDGRLIFIGANPAADRILGVDNSQYIGKTIEEAFPPLRDTEVPERYRQAAAKGKSWSTVDITYEDVKIKGAYKVYAFQTSPGMMVAMFLDVTENKRAELALRESEEKHRMLFESANDAIYLIDPLTQRILDCNRKAAEMDGYSIEELKTMTAEALHPDNEKLLLPEKFVEVTEKGSVSGISGLHHKRKDGVQVPVEVHASKIELEGKMLNLSIVRDVTERIKAREALLKEKATIESLLESMPGIVYQIDSSGRLVKWNKHFENVSGYSKNEITGMNTTEFFTNEEKELISSAILKVFSEGYAEVEATVLSKEGKKIPFLLTGTLKIIDDIPYIIGMGLDITERKCAEEELKSSEERLKLLFEYAPDAYYLSDLKGFFIDGNKETEKTLGYKREELIGKNFLKLKLLSPNQLPKAVELLAKNVLGKSTGPDKFTLYRKDGTQIIVEIRTYPIKIKDKTVVLGIARDITEGIQAEEALRSSEEKFSKAFHASPFLMVLVDLETKCRIDVNNGFTKITGYSREEVINTTLDELNLHINQKNKFEEGFKLLTEKGTLKKFSLKIRTKDDQERILLYSGETFESGNKKYALMIAEDITDRIKAEEELRKQEAHQALVLGSLPMAFYIAQPFGDYGGTWVSEQIGKISGFSSEQFKDSIHLWRSRLHPDDRDRVLSEFDKLPEKEAIKIEYRWQTADGRYLWFLDCGVLIRDKNGKPREIIGTWLDITERKQAEEKLQEATKMEAIGKLAGGVAHDFNNALTPIIGITDMLLIELNQNHPLYNELKEINIAGTRCAGLTRQLLAFARRQPLEMITLNLNDVVDNTEKMLSRIIGEDIELVKYLEPELKSVKADVGQIEQIIMNLAVNARDAMPDGGKFTIETRNVILDEAYDKNHVSVKSGYYVMLALSDNGMGMDEKTRSKAFDPFFTTKEKGKGTGLGLSTVYGIVKQCSGNIWIYSEPGMGTTFKIYFPIVEEEPENLSVPVEADLDTLKGSETILLVEDDDAVRTVTRLMLTRNGYKVLEASNGEEAIKMFKASDEEIDLMVTDVVMPGMSGKNLADTLSSLFPALKILFISGYTDDAIVHHGVLDKGTLFIQKPFAAEVLYRKVREVLDKK